MAPLPLQGPPNIPLLRVVAGHDVLRFAVLEGRDTVELGRDADCTISLSDPSVSRRHARVVREGDEFLVEDLGSRNGTRLNGREVQRGPFSPGDRIEVGNVVVRFE